MPTRKYIVRDGFVVMHAIVQPNGQIHERTYIGGEEIALDDDDAALHRHKLEFASQRDRDAALAAEKEAKVATASASNPVELVQALIAALGQAQAAAGVPQDEPAPTA